METKSQNQRKCQSSQHPIIATADDAILSKLSTSQCGYYEDPFLPFFAQHANGVTSATSVTSSSSLSTSVRTNLKSRTHVNPHHRIGHPSQGLHDGRGRNKNILGPFCGDDDDDLDSFDGMSMGEERLRSHHDGGYERSNGHGSRYGSGYGHRRGHGHIPHPSCPPRQQSRGQQQHQPVIRRGTHARVCVMDYAISSFLDLCSDVNSGETLKQDVQIVLLGSGRDTTFLRAQGGYLHSRTRTRGEKRTDTGVSTSIETNHKNESEQGGNGNIRWYEVDHPSVIQTKFELLQSCPLIDFDHQVIHASSKNSDGDDNKSFDGDTKEAIPLTRQSYIVTPTAIQSFSHPHGTKTDGCSAKKSFDSCHLVGYDLCHSFEDLLKTLISLHNFQIDIPSLFVMECVQMYLPEATSRHIAQTITDKCHIPLIAIFDPIVQNDAFGKVMVQNLTKARVADPSMSLLNTTTLQQQVDKQWECGFQSVVGCDFYSAYEHILTASDRRRAAMTEMLDEVEEWMLIMRHYCFVVAGGVMKTKARLEKDDTMFDERAYKEYNRIVNRFCSTGKESVLGFVKCIARVNAR